MRTGGATWQQRLGSLLSPQVDDRVLQDALSRVRTGQPAPVIWLLGKVQAGKTSIIRALTGAQSAQIGAGFAPCTRWAQRYDFPSPDFPLAVFLDTRGVGQAGYDPREDLAAFQAQAHMVLVVVKAMDMALEPLLSALRTVRRARPGWPVVVAQTALHEGYPADWHDHLRPYPFRTRVPSDLARALAFQRGRFADMRVRRFVPLDFTLPEDGFEDAEYGREALLDALAEAHPHAVYHTLGQLPELTAELKSVHFRHAQPHLLAYAFAAGAVGASPLPVADLPVISALQLKLLHTISSIYRQPLGLKTFLELGSTVGVGLLLRQGARSVLKAIPGLGQTVSGVYAGAATYALGSALCLYYQAVFDGHLPRPEQLRAFYQQRLTEGLELLGRRGPRAE